MAGAPGRLIGSGRAADVFDIGGGRVLRRYRPGEGADTAPEALVMRHAREHGFPVPEVFDSDGLDLVLERVDGPTMMADIQRRPWKVGSHGHLLGELHSRLATIPAPDGVHCPLERGDTLAHFDLHPENVLLSPNGPVVIDWSGAGRGEHADDVALSTVIMATSAIPGSALFQAVGRAGRRLLVDAYKSRTDPAAGARLPELAAFRLNTDPHLLDVERQALARLAGKRRG